MTLREIRAAAKAEEDSTLRDKKLEELLTAEGLPNHTDSDYWFIVGFYKILQEYRGCRTPTEEFLYDLVYCHIRWKAMTPKYAKDKLADFEESFDDALVDARNMLADFPKEIGPTAAA